MTNWAAPEECQPHDSPQPLSAEQVLQWRTHGWLVLSNLWPASLIGEAVAAAECLFPTPEEHAAGAANHGTTNFPFDYKDGDPLNQLTVHPRFVSMASQLLGTTEIRLTQASVSCRYEDSGEQQHHQDYGNNYLTVPPPERIETVNVIMYYGDVRESGGPTYFVPNLGYELSGSGGGLEGGGIDNSPAGRPQIYVDEKAPDFRPGTALVYHQAVFHRGAGPTNPGMCHKRPSKVPQL